MNITGVARVTHLQPYDCWRLIEPPGHIARVVWTGADGPAIVPVNYTIAAGSVWFQTSPDSALGRECEGQGVLVEVDHVDAATHSGWSVIIAGDAQFVDPGEVPEILGDLQIWPQGVHTLFVRVAPDRVTGRRLVSRRTQ